MYGVRGERRLRESELEWLPGYAGSRPVRVGNAAHAQVQLDVFGELLDAMHTSADAGLAPGENAWRVERAALEFLARAWKEPDHGIWEVRAERRHFTHSKVMAWVAFDRAVKAVERFGVEAPVARWRTLRDEIHHEVCARGWDAERGAFVQAYGSRDLDASLLLIPVVGFLPATDPRVRATIEAIERELVEDGLVRRYVTRPDVDGLPGGEGVFLLCSFWLADALSMLGRTEDARRLFERLLAPRQVEGGVHQSDV
jgi:GH15 family glucan-1,4-alpha-glucosidase